ANRERFHISEVVATIEQFVEVSGARPHASTLLQPTRRPLPRGREHRSGPRLRAARARPSASDRTSVTEKSAGHQRGRLSPSITLLTCTLTLLSAVGRC